MAKITDLGNAVGLGGVIGLDVVVVDMICFCLGVVAGLLL